MLRISCSEAVVCTQRCRISKARNIKTLTYTPAPLYILCNDVVVCTERCRITNRRNKQTHIHIILSQPTMHILYSEVIVCTERCKIVKARNTQTYTPGPAYGIYFLQQGGCVDPKDAELAKQETHTCTLLH